MNKLQKNISERFENHRWTRSISKFIKTSSLPGFKGIPIYNIATFIARETQKDDMTTRANSMAFSFFISLFPFLILIFSIITYLPIENIRLVVQNAIHGLMPIEAENYILGLVDDVFSRGRGDLLSVGIVLTLYFASNGLEAMMRGFDKSYEITFKKRNWIQRRLGAIKMTFLIGIVCILSAVIFVLSSITINWLKDNTVMGGFEFFSFQLIRWIIILIVYFGAFAMIYHYAPAVKRKFAFFSPGTNVAAILSLVSSIVFSYFVNRFGNYDKFYGSLGTMVMIMLWLQINCFILLAGFELNASIAVNRDLREQKANNS